MEKNRTVELIDKSALVAEIERRFDEYTSSILKHYDACKEARASELSKILIIINTLEVKDVAKEKQQWIEKAVIFLNERVCTQMSIPEIHNMIVDFRKSMED